MSVYSIKLLQFSSYVLGVEPEGFVRMPFISWLFLRNTEMQSIEKEINNKKLKIKQI